ncbi:hypothetical protein BGZ82_004024, partial [Podila clonocystis]
MATASTAARESEQLDPRTLRSWVYLNGWASKRPLGDGQFEISCLFRGCKKKYKVSKGSTSNIDKHLKNDHHLTNAIHNNGTNQVPLGPLDLVMAATNGRSAPEPVTKDNFMDALIKFIVSNKLPMTLVEDTTFQSLLNVAQLAQSQEIVRLPSKDTISTK